MGEIVRDLYGSNLTHLAASTQLSQLLSNVFDKEHDLLRWVDALPSYNLLIATDELDSDFNSDLISLPFRVILTLRYLNVRMLLHRAVLSHLLAAVGSELKTNKQRFAFGTATSSIDTCLDTAMQTVSIVSRGRHRQDVLPIWWYSIYFCESSSELPRR